MMGKVIIDNRGDLSDIEAMDMVARVMMGGRVSNGGLQYCYATVFKVDGQEYAVYSSLNKNSDKFEICGPIASSNKGEG